jgi:hypothetical protein
VFSNVGRPGCTVFLKDPEKIFPRIFLAKPTTVLVTLPVAHIIGIDPGSLMSAGTVSISRTSKGLCH